MKLTLRPTKKSLHLEGKPRKCSPPQPHQKPNTIVPRSAHNIWSFFVSETLWFVIWRHAQLSLPGAIVDRPFADALGTKASTAKTVVRWQILMVFITELFLWCHRVTSTVNMIWVTKVKCDIGRHSSDLIFHSMDLIIPINFPVHIRKALEIRVVALCAVKSPGLDLSL